MRLCGGLTVHEAMHVSLAQKHMMAIFQASQYIGRRAAGKNPDFVAFPRTLGRDSESHRVGPEELLAGEGGPEALRDSGYPALRRVQRHHPEEVL